MAEARHGRVGVGQGVAGRARPGQSQGGWRMVSGELGWPVRGEQAAGHRRAGKNKKTGGARPRNIMTHLMFLSFLTWPRNISHYVPRRSDVAEEHKDPPYVPRPGRSGQ
jgi:hypothetical protein